MTVSGSLSGFVATKPKAHSVAPARNKATRLSRFLVTSSLHLSNAPAKLRAAWRDACALQQAA